MLSKEQISMFNFNGPEITVAPLPLISIQEPDI